MMCMLPLEKFLSILDALQIILKEEGKKISNSFEEEKVSRKHMSRVFRELIETQKLVIAPGAHNPLIAKIAKTCGFDAVYMTGFGTSVSMLGLPDVGLITMHEMVSNARNIVNAVDIPVIADADTGYGNAVNVLRTVKEFIRAGVAGIHIEDQEFPKRCGHVAGKQVISTEEMIGKLNAALDTRNEEDPDFYIIARTDAKTVLGLEEAIERAKMYLAAGVDMIFIDGIKSEEEVEVIAKEVKGPMLYNVAGMAPLIPIDRLAKLGFRLVIYPTIALRVALRSVMNVMRALKEKQILALKDFEVMESSELYSLVGFSEIRKLEEKYLPKKEVSRKYLTEGWQP